MKPLYTATATAVGGRDGTIKSSDGILEMPVRAPKELGGPGGATNPEQLFAAGYAACFESALRLVARMGGTQLQLQDASVTAHVTLGKTPEHVYGISVELVGKLPGMDRAAAEQLMESAHKVCPYSNATRGNVEVKLRVE
jgi:lipoyl-dependent peroxiredoxin